MLYCTLYYIMIYYTILCDANFYMRYTIMPAVSFIASRPDQE